MDGNIIHFVHMMKPLQNFATFTFGAVIPSLGDFSGHIVILEKIRKIYFKKFLGVTEEHIFPSGVDRINLRVTDWKSA